MTPERAIELLKISAEISFAHNIAEKRDEPREAYRIAKTAIERCVVAKKPVKDKEQHMRYVTTYSCPSCGGGFSGTGVVKHCPNCGQLIDWSDTDE